MNIDIDHAYTSASIPDNQQISLWASTALKASPLKAIHANPEISIRIVGNDEIQHLNHHYRGKNTTTNVLSFPTDFPEGVDIALLGDVVIAAPVVELEAKNQGKPIHAHWAHLIIHGTLHLMGYDHIDTTEASIMEALETKLMQSLGYPCPYSV